MLKQIIVLSVIVVVLFIGTVILKNNISDKKFKWNYSKIDSANSILVEGKKINNRNLYWNLKEIIYNFLYTMQEDELEDIDIETARVTYMDYYATLSKKYKRYLSREEYAKRAEVFIGKFLYEDHLGYKYVGDFIINNIYEYDEDRYLCELMEEDSNTLGYIGIEMNQKDATFSIFYIE